MATNPTSKAKAALEPLIAAFAALFSVETIKNIATDEKARDFVMSLVQDPETFDDEAVAFAINRLDPVDRAELRRRLQPGEMRKIALAYFAVREGIGRPFEKSILIEKTKNVERRKFITEPRTDPETELFLLLQNLVEMPEPEFHAWLAEFTEAQKKLDKFMIAFNHAKTFLVDIDARVVSMNKKIRRPSGRLKAKPVGWWSWLR